MGKKIEYTNGELTIVWQPELCRNMCKDATQCLSSQRKTLGAD